MRGATLVGLITQVRDQHVLELGVAGDFDDVSPRSRL